MPLTLQDAIKHCVRCGGKLACGDHHSCKCTNCGYVQHYNPITAVGVIIYDHAEQVVLLRRNRDPGKGKLGLPGGFVDLGETAEQAASREILEEIGINLSGFEFVCTFPNQYVYQDVVVPVLDIFYCIRVDDLGKLTIDEDEVGGAEKFSLDETTFAQIAFQSNRKALEAMKLKLEDAKIGKR